MALNGHHNWPLDVAPQTGSMDFGSEQLLNTFELATHGYQLMLRLHYSMFQNVLSIWQESFLTQYNVAFDLLQFNLDQSLVARERLDIIIEHYLKHLQEMTMDEQRLTLEAAEIFQAQTEAVNEQVVEMWWPKSNSDHG